MGPQEPFWHTNSSFSPPGSRRLDYTYQSEGIVYGSHSGVQFYGSSLSSDSKGSSISIRDNHIPDHYVSDGAQSDISSPTDSLQTPQWRLMPMIGVAMNDSFSGSVKEPEFKPSRFTSTMEGTSAAVYSDGSTSSLSDCSDYETFMANFPTNCSFSSRNSFKSKPIHPISYLNKPTVNDIHHFHPYYVEENQSVSGTSEVDSTTPQRRWSSGSSSIDFSDFSENLDAESNVGPTHRTIISSEGFECSLCERFIFHRSPWSSRRIIRINDMPVTSVLPCHHIFHADCLEKAVSKTQNHDPPCPLCTTSDRVEQQSTVVSRLRNGIPRLRLFGGEDGNTSQPWGTCGQVGDCVDGALHPPPGSMMLLNRSRLKKHLSFKGYPGEEISDMKKVGSFSSQLYIGGSFEQDSGCSEDSPQLKKM